MRRVVSAAEMRALEAQAEQLGTSVSKLMESAGGALARVAEGLAAPEGRFIVLCGPGNNGGDGLVAARQLARKGRTVHVELAGPVERLGAEPARQLRALETTGLRPAKLPDAHAARPGDVVVDALLGTGLSRAPEGELAVSIERIAAWRGQGAKVVAADLPSGLPSDGAPPLSPCVQADVTVTFGALKLGQVSAEGAALCGITEVVPIGLGPEHAWPLATAGVWEMEEEDARQRLPVRGASGHKGTYGHVLVVAGSPGKTGAAALCGRAVLRSGAGLCTLATRAEALTGAMAATPELMGEVLPGTGPLGPRDAGTLKRLLEGKTAWVAGPGIARDDHTGELLSWLLASSRVPGVLDADALNALAGRTDAVVASGGQVVLTPHPGEMARLLESDTRSVQADRRGAALKLAERCKAVVVLKGARTLVAAPDGRLFVNPTGNPGMATGGTGDVLSGVCGGLLAQGLSPLEAAQVAVYAHGLAGDLASARTGQLGLLASDVLEELTAVWRRWGR